MAKDRIPPTRRALRWADDVIADGALWKKAVLYGLGALFIALVLILVVTQLSGSGGGEGAVPALLLLP